MRFFCQGLCESYFGGWGGLAVLVLNSDLWNISVRYEEKWAISERGRVVCQYV